MTKKLFNAQSKKANPNDAVLELKEIFNAQNTNAKNIKAITFFASSNYEHAELINAMNKCFPNITVWGCTSNAEMNSGTITTNSVVAMAFTDEIIEDVKIEVIDNENINTEATVCAFEKYYSTPISELDNTKYIGLVYFNGLAGKNEFLAKEELILDELNEYSNIFLIGGSASDDYSFKKAVTYANGQYYINSTVVALIKPKVKFGFEKMQSVVPTEHKVIATKVDEAKRIIYELNGQPAGEYYCKLIGVPNSELQNTIFEYSLGYMIDGEPFLRAVIYKGNDDILELGCCIKKGMELVIMRSENLIANTQRSWEEVKQKYDSIAGILSFDCTYRHIILTQSGQIDEYAKLFAEDFPVMGFYTFGETYIGHLSQTLVMLVFEGN
jgi:hypothetical protein